MNEYVSMWVYEKDREGNPVRRVLNPLVLEEFVLCYANIEIDAQVNAKLRRERQLDFLTHIKIEFDWFVILKFLQDNFFLF